MEPIYHGMSRAELDDAYNLTALMADAPAVLADFQRRSDRVYQQYPCQRNLQYGAGLRTTLDYFPSPQPDAPTLIFMHGGFWQSSNKELFAFIVAGLNVRYQVILAEYTLAPQATMTQIYAEIAELLNWLQAHRVQLKLQPGQICLSGHSAGGQLAAMHRNHPLISHAMWLSGLVDLTPIRLCYLNTSLQLTADEVQLFSPANSIRKGVPTAVHVGADERSEMLNQSDRYARLLAAARLGGVRLLDNMAAGG